MKKKKEKQKPRGTIERLGEKSQLYSTSSKREIADYIASLFVG